MNAFKVIGNQIRHVYHQHTQYYRLRKRYPQILIASARARARGAWNDMTMNQPLQHPNGTKIYLVGAGHYLQESGDRVVETVSGARSQEPSNLFVSGAPQTDDLDFSDAQRAACRFGVGARSRTVG
ncbi:hypothetical protein HDU93_006774, partial [Gonapodya sp. JEL0774]